MLVSYRSGVGMRCDRAGRVCEVKAAAVASGSNAAVKVGAGSSSSKERGGLTPSGT